MNKELEALKIIKHKFVNVQHLMLRCNTVEQYNESAEIKRRLTQEEFDLLKEVLL